jgi:repressor LexA
MKEPLTAQQSKLLRFITGHIRQEGHPPTIREVGKAFGFRSTGTVRDHLAALRRKNYLRTLPGKSRGLLPVDWRRGLPLLGRVPAGGPVLTEENLEGNVDLTTAFTGEKVFALKVQGDSMMDAGIRTGDLVVVRAQDHAEPEDIVVALVDGEATVKRLARRNGKLWLQPANPSYEPLPVKGETRVAGKVIGVLRSYEQRF